MYCKSSFDRINNPHSKYSIYKLDLNGNIIKCYFCGEFIKIGDFSVKNMHTGRTYHFAHSNGDENHN